MLSYWGGHASPVPSAPAPGGHEGLTPASGVSGELDREMKEGSFAGPVLGVPSSSGEESGSGLGLTGKKDNVRQLGKQEVNEEVKCYIPASLKPDRRL